MHPDFSSPVREKLVLVNTVCLAVVLFCGHGVKRWVLSPNCSVCERSVAKPTVQLFQLRCMCRCGAKVQVPYSEVHTRRRAFFFFVEEVTTWISCSWQLTLQKKQLHARCGFGSCLQNPARLVEARQINYETTNRWVSVVTAPQISVVSVLFALDHCWRKISRQIARQKRYLRGSVTIFSDNLRLFCTSKHLRMLAQVSWTSDHDGLVSHTNSFAAQDESTKSRFFFCDLAGWAPLFFPTQNAWKKSPVIVTLLL